MDSNLGCSISCYLKVIGEETMAMNVDCRGHLIRKLENRIETAMKHELETAVI